MIRLLRFVTFPSWLVVMPLLAPINVGIDVRPAARIRIVQTVGRLENCASLFNPGCLRYAKQAGAVPGPGGYARFESLQLGHEALISWWERHGCLSLEDALGVYNPVRSDYAEVVLRTAQLPGDLIIGEGCE